MIENNPKKPYPYHVRLYWSIANSLELWLRHKNADFGWGIDPNDKLYDIIYYGDSAADLVVEWTEMYKSEVVE